MDSAPVVSQVILEAVAGELPFDGVARAAHAVSVGTSALDHKAGDHPVENQPVVKALLYQMNEIIHRIGSNVRV